MGEMADAQIDYLINRTPFDEKAFEDMCFRQFCLTLKHRDSKELKKFKLLLKKKGWIN